MNSRPWLWTVGGILWAVWALVLIWVPVGTHGLLYVGAPLWTALAVSGPLAALVAGWFAAQRQQTSGWAMLAGYNAVTLAGLGVFGALVVTPAELWKVLGGVVLGIVLVNAGLGQLWRRVPGRLPRATALLLAGALTVGAAVFGGWLPVGAMASAGETTMLVTSPEGRVLDRCRPLVWEVVERDGDTWFQEGDGAAYRVNREGQSLACPPLTATGADAVYTLWTTATDGSEIRVEVVLARVYRADWVWLFGVGLAVVFLPALWGAALPVDHVLQPATTDAKNGIPTKPL